MIRQNKKIVIRDIFLLFVLIMLSLAIFLCISYKQNTDKKIVVITKDNTLIQEISLDEVSENYDINVDGDIPVVISVGKDCIYFKKSDCPDKICVNTGKLTRVGDIAVCLPAKVSVEIRGSEKSFDSITG